VEVMNRFKGLDLVERVPEEIWTQRRLQGGALKSEKDFYCQNLRIDLLFKTK